MSTYTQILYHIVFATKGRRRVLDKPRREDLFRYTWGIVKNHDGHLYRIGGVEDHIHILSSLHPTVALADFIKNIKVASSKWIKEERVFPEFETWQEGYAALTFSLPEKDRLIEYVKAQEEHHRVIAFLDEYREMLRKAGMELDERYLP
jgi:REP element-mobilizing transposase RayT